MNLYRSELIVNLSAQDPAVSGSLVALPLKISHLNPAVGSVQLVQAVRYQIH